MDRCRTGLFPTVVLAVSLGLAACGGGESRPPGAAATTVVSPEVAAYCEKVEAIETESGPEEDFSKLTPQQQAEETKKYVRKKIQPLAHEIRGLAPAAIRSDVEVLVRAVDEVVETGDFEGVFGRPDVERASAIVHRHDLSACGFRRVDVTAVDYAFQGLPPTLPAGTASFELANTGTEVHEIIFLKKKDGVTESFDAILALPEEQAMTTVTFKGATQARPGEPDVYVLQQLERGSYAVVCFVPVGTTPEAAEAAARTGQEPAGPPHFTRGMKAELTVT